MLLSPRDRFSFWRVTSSAPHECELLDRARAASVENCDEVTVRGD